MITETLLLKNCCGKIAKRQERKIINMSLYSIALFSLRALLFAAVVGFVYGIIYVTYAFVSKRKINIKRFVLSVTFVCFLASLYQVTVIRNWESFFDLKFPDFSFQTVQIIPFRTTVITARNSVWSFVYNAFGNMFWFFPLGMIAPPLFKKIDNLFAVVLLGFSVSVSIEILQWFFTTGVSDIDDVIFNVFGTVVGYLLYKHFNVYYRLFNVLLKRR